MTADHSLTTSSHPTPSQPAWILATVWILRIAVGLLFIFSGFAKADDLYGSVYKIEEYFAVWDISTPRSLIIVGSMALSGAEFAAGAMLLLGCYKRTCVWLMIAMMLFFLPLTAWIAAADPVPDCGCFGDLWVLSNTATLVKNILITLALIFLAVYNSKVSGVFGAYIQWLVATACSLYIILIAIWGYNIQPMLDFRSFPQGTDLAARAAGESDTEPVYTFIYEKDGARSEFTADALPDTSWTFVDRVLTSGSEDSATDLAAYDTEGENVAADIIAAEGPQLIICIPEIQRADVSATYLINSMSARMQKEGGSTLCLIAADSAGIELWRDLSMAAYPIYSAESTVLKELARGVMPVVFLNDGIIVWKRTASSIDPDEFNSLPDPTFPSLAIDGKALFRNLTLILLAILAVLLMLDRSGKYLTMKKRFRQLTSDSRK